MQEDVSILIGLLRMLLLNEMPNRLILRDVCMYETASTSTGRHSRTRVSHSAMRFRSTYFQQQQTGYECGHELRKPNWHVAGIKPGTSEDTHHGHWQNEHKSDTSLGLKKKYNRFCSKVSYVGIPSRLENTASYCVRVFTDRRNVSAQWTSYVDAHLSRDENQFKKYHHTYVFMTQFPYRRQPHLSILIPRRHDAHIKVTSCEGGDEPSCLQVKICNSLRVSLLQLQKKAKFRKRMRYLLLRIEKCRIWHNLEIRTILGNASFIHKLNDRVIKITVLPAFNSEPMLLLIPFLPPLTCK